MEEAKEVNNNAQVARNRGISETSVRTWRKNEDKLSKKFFQIYNLENSWMRFAGKEIIYF